MIKSPTADESLEFEELGAYDPASGGVLLARRFLLGNSLAVGILIGIGIASARTFHSVKTQNPNLGRKGVWLEFEPILGEGSLKSFQDLNFNEGGEISTAVHFPASVNIIYKYIF